MAWAALAGLLVKVATMDLAVPKVAELAANTARDDVVPDVLDGGVLTTDGGEGGFVKGAVPVDDDTILVVPHSPKDLVEHPVLLRRHRHASEGTINEIIRLSYYSIQVSFHERNTRGKGNTDHHRSTQMIHHIYPTFVPCHQI